MAASKPASGSAVHGSLLSPSSSFGPHHPRVARPEGDRLQSHATRLLLLALIVAICFTAFAWLMGGEPAPSQGPPPLMRELFAPLSRPFTDCADPAGVSAHVHSGAQGEAYLHSFEYAQIHPCCVPGGLPTSVPPAGAWLTHAVRQTAPAVTDASPALARMQAPPPPPLPPLPLLPSTTGPLSPAGGAPVGLDDILFVVVTSPHRHAHAAAALQTWARGIESIIFVSDEVAAKRASPAASARSRSSAAAAEPGDVDSPVRFHLAVKYLAALPSYPLLAARYRWVFVLPDSTWVNPPALLRALAPYSPACPVALGHALSKVTLEAVDYPAAHAGLILSAPALRLLAEAQLERVCPFHTSYDTTLGRCLWSARVQLVHLQALAPRPPERSRDRQQQLWLPPVAEMATLAHVTPVEMAILTDFSLRRWQFGQRGDRRTAVDVAMPTEALLDRVLAARFPAPTPSTSSSSSSSASSAAATAAAARAVGTATGAPTARSSGAAVAAAAAGGSVATGLAAAEFAAAVQRVDIAEAVRSDARLFPPTYAAIVEGLAKFQPEFGPSSASASASSRSYNPRGDQAPSSSSSWASPASSSSSLARVMRPLLASSEPSQPSQPSEQQQEQRRQREREAASPPARHGGFRPLPDPEVPPRTPQRTPPRRDAADVEGVVNRRRPDTRADSAPASPSASSAAGVDAHSLGAPLPPPFPGAAAPVASPVDVAPEYARPPTSPPPAQALIEVSSAAGAVPPPAYADLVSSFSSSPSSPATSSSSSPSLAAAVAAASPSSAEERLRANPLTPRTMLPKHLAPRGKLRTNAEPGYRALELPFPGKDRKKKDKKKKGKGKDKGKIKSFKDGLAASPSPALVPALVPAPAPAALASSPALGPAPAAAATPLSASLSHTLSLASSSPVPKAAAPSSSSPAPAPPAPTPKPSPTASSPSPSRKRSQQRSARRRARTSSRRRTSQRRSARRAARRSARRRSRRSPRRAAR